MKRFAFFIATVILFCDCENSPKHAKEDATIYLGDYEHKGVAINYYTVTNHGETKKEIVMSSFFHKNLSIFKEPDGDRVVTYGDRYGLSYAEVRNGALMIDGKEGTFVDDGSYIEKGTVMSYSYDHHAASFRNDTLIWITICTITGSNPNNGATLEIISDIENKATKRVQ